MNLIPLGACALPVTRMGLGLAALGRPGYINLGHARDLNQAYEQEQMENHAHTVLDAAWDAGIRYYDAARSYGRAEAFLSSWLRRRQLTPDALTIGSKWGYTYTAGWQVQAEQHEVKEHELPVLQRQIAESRALLGDYLDLYQIHSATLTSGVLKNRPVLDELARLRADGLCIGLSLSGQTQDETLQRALEIEYDGRLLFGAVQATWNLLAQEAGATLETAHAAGMGVIIKEALANGRLTPRNQEAGFREKLALLDATAAQHGTGIDAIALAAVLAQPWVDVVLSGAATVEHIWANVQALEVDLGDSLSGLQDALHEPAERYWTKRSDLPWN